MYCEALITSTYRCKKPSAGKVGILTFQRPEENLRHTVFAMDHLPRPTGTFREPLQVPYVCNETFTYDNSGFFEYEARCLRAIANPSDERSDDKEAFMQSWLIFGVLHEIFVCISGLEMCQEDFIRTRDDGKRVLTMMKLNELIYQWHAREERSDLQSKKARVVRVLRCLDATDEFIMPVTENLGSSLPDDAELDDPFSPHYPTLAAILLCATVLGFELNRALWTVFGDAVPQTLHIRGQGFEMFDIRVPDELPGLAKRDFKSANGPNIVTTKWMEKAGWCPFEIATCDRTFLSQGNIAVRLYLGFIDRRPLNVDHSGCTSERCKGNEVDFTTYRVRHGLSDDCDCDHVVLEEPKDIPPVSDSIISSTEPESLPFLLSLVGYPAISAAVLSGATPLLRLDGLSLSIHEWKDGELPPPFVAISHVWSEGMGNPSRNSLPECTIKIIQYMAEQSCPGVENLHFWIDTLCVPTLNAGARKRAIMNMRNIYSNAENVLVFDRSLRLASGYTYREELLMRIKVSLWATRLWTLQEGRLSKKLAILFKDRIYKPGTAMENATFSQVQAVYFEEPEIAKWEKDCLNKKNLWALELLRAAAAASLEDAPEALKRVGATETPYRGSLVSRIHWFGKLKYVRHDAEYSFLSITSQGPVVGLPHEAFFNLVPYLTNRSLTHPEDETICLATLVGLDLEPLLNCATHAERMFLFLKMVGKLPRGILFIEAEKSQELGRRWMPLSLVLQGRVRIFGQADMEDQCTINAEGRLELSSPGLVSRESFRWCLTQTLYMEGRKVEVTDNQVTQHIILSLSDGRKFFVGIPVQHQPKQLSHDEKQWGVIFSQPVDRDHLPQRIAVVSLVHDSDSDGKPEPKYGAKLRNEIRGMLSRPRKPGSLAESPEKPRRPETALRVRYEFLAWIFPAEDNTILKPKIFQPSVSWECEVAKARVVPSGTTTDGQRWIVE